MLVQDKAHRDHHHHPGMAYETEESKRRNFTSSRIKRFNDHELSPIKPKEIEHHNNTHECHALKDLWYQQTDEETKLLNKLRLILC